MKVILAFIMAFGAFFLGAMGMFYRIKAPSRAVLSSRIEVTPTPTIEATQIETSSPTAMPTETPTPKPSPRPSPTPSPTQTPSPSPSASPSISPTPTPFIWIPTDMSPFFAKYAGQYGVDENVIARIANCESHFNPDASNGVYLGMFQYNISKWKSDRSKMGLDTNPALRSNVEESIKTAAFTVSKNGTSPWPNCLR